MLSKLILLIKVFLSKKIVKSSGIYLLSNLISASVPFLVLPILTQYLSNEDYGITFMFYTVCTFLFPFVGASTLGYITLRYDVPKERLAEIIASCFFILIGSTILVGFGIYGLRFYLSELTGMPTEWLWHILVNSVAQYIVNISLYLCMMHKKEIKYAFFQIGQTIINVSLTLIFIVLLKYNWVGRVFAMNSAVVVAALFSIFYLYKENLIHINFSRKTIKETLTFGLSLIPHFVGSLFINMLGRFFIAKYVNIAEAGIYAVAVQLGMAIYLLTSSVNNAFTPWLFENLKANKEEFKIQIVKFTYKYFAVLTFVAFIYLLVMHFLFPFMVGEKFALAEKYLWIIVWGHVFQGFYFMVATYIFYSEKSHIIAWITFSNGILSFILNYFLVRSYGVGGAAISFVITWVSFFVCTWFLSQKIYPMPWNIKTLFKK